MSPPLALDAQDRQDSWSVVQLVELTGGRRYASIDFDGLSVPYEGRILDDIEVSKHARESFFGTQEVASTVIRLANGDGALDTIYSADIRDTPVTVKRFDRISGQTFTEFTGVVSKVSRGVGVVEVEATSQNVAILETLIPKVLTDTTTFPNIRDDAGQPIKVIFGNVPKVKLLYVNDDTVNNFYDYLVGWGALTITAVYRDFPGTDTSVSLVGASEYTVETARYAGMTSIRFTSRQTRHGGGLHVLYADVTGLATQRNFARAIEYVLSNTDAGLSETVNAASFAAAASALDAVTGLLCDGVLDTQRPAMDVLQDLCRVRGIRLEQNASGEWTATVDTEKATAKMAVGDGTSDGERNILRAGLRSRPSLDEQVSVYKVKYRLDLLTGEYLFPQERTVHTFGQERVVELPFVRDHTTADKVVHYLAKREELGAERLELTLTQEARQVVEGDILQVTYAPLGLTASDWEVLEVRKDPEEIEVVLGSWSDTFYDYVAGTLPTDNQTGTETDQSRTNPDPVTNLSLQATGLEPATDGGMLAFAVLEYDTPATNFKETTIRHRITGATEWAEGAGGSTASGVNTRVKVPGLARGKNYDFSVRCTNGFQGRISTDVTLLNQAMPGETTAIATGHFRNLHIRTHEDNDKRLAQVRLVKADEITLVDDDGNSFLVSDWENLVANIASAGAGGLDTGAEAADTWYSIWAIRRPDTGVKNLLLHREKDYFEDEAQTLVAQNSQLRNSNDIQQLAQGFQVDQAGLCEFVDLVIRKNNSPTGDLWVEIQSDSSGNPSGTALATSDRLNVAWLSAASGPSNSDRRRFVFRAPATLATSTQYHLVVKSDAAISATNFILIFGTNTDAYATRGELKRFDGTNWVNTDATGFDGNPGDMAFWVYITRNDAAVTMPASYTQRALIGYVRNDGSSNLIGFIARDRLVKLLADISTGNFTNTVPRLFSLVAAMPPGRVTVWCHVTSNTDQSLIFGAGVPEGYALDVASLGESNGEFANVSGGGGRSPLAPFPTEFQAVYTDTTAGTCTLLVRSYQW